MSEQVVSRDYDRWLSSHSPSSVGYAFLASVPGAVLANTPLFQLVQNLGLKPEQRLLDIGCGRGSLLQILSSRVAFEKPAVGIDLSSQMLRQAIEDKRHAGGAYELSQGSALSLPFADESFDLVTCAYVVKHLDDPGLGALLVEVRRVLKFGGICLLWEFAPTRSQRLNQLNRHVLTRGPQDCNLRGYAELWQHADAAGFEWVRNAGLRPFLFPPIPRISIIAGKAPSQWVSSREELAAAAGLGATEDTI